MDGVLSQEEISALLSEGTGAEMTAKHSHRMKLMP